MSRNAPALLVAASAALLLLAAVATPAARGDDPTVEDFTGAWTYASGDEGRRRVDEAVDQAVSALPPLVEGVAEERIESRIGPFNEIRFRYDGRRLTFSADGWGPNTSPWGSGSSPIEGPTGSSLTLTQRMTDDGRLLQIFEAGDATRWNHFTLSDDQRHLWMDARLRSEHLPEDAEFRLRYVRAGG